MNFEGTKSEARGNVAAMRLRREDRSLAQGRSFDVIMLTFQVVLPQVAHLTAKQASTGMLCSVEKAIVVVDECEVLSISKLVAIRGPRHFRSKQR